MPRSRSTSTTRRFVSAGLVVTRTARDNLSRDVDQRLREMYGPLVFATTIPTSAKIGEAHARFLSVLDYAPKSSGAVAYANLVTEIINRGQDNRRLGIDSIGTAETDDANGTRSRTTQTRRRMRATTTTRAGGMTPGMLDPTAGPQSRRPEADGRRRSERRSRGTST